MTFTVFISSSTQDKYVVKELVNVLHKYGIEARVPWRSLAISEEYVKKISQLIQNSDCVLVIISLRALTHLDNVNYEIELARKLFRPIIPIVEHGAYIPDSLRDKEYIVIDRTQPKLSYENAAKYINSLKIQKEKRSGLGGLLLLGIGLLLLADLTSEE